METQEEDKRCSTMWCADCYRPGGDSIVCCKRPRCKLCHAAHQRWVHNVKHEVRRPPGKGTPWRGLTIGYTERTPCPHKLP